MPFMYCDPPAAIVEATPSSYTVRAVNDRSGKTPRTNIVTVRLASGVSFEVESDHGIGQELQEWSFSKHLRKTDHITVCFGPPMAATNPAFAKLHDRFAIVGDVETGFFIYVLTIRES
jgi:hypothetical protein